MRVNHYPYKRLLSLRVILFVVISIIEILLIVFLFSGKLDSLIKMTDTLKGIFGGFFGLSLTFSIHLFLTLFIEYKASTEYKYENILKETDLKYSIYQKELEKQKSELSMLLKDQEKSDILKDRLQEIEKLILELQRDKFYELKGLLEFHDEEKTLKNSH